MAIKAITGGGFQDAQGNKIVSGLLVLRLSQDGNVSGSGQIAPSTVSFTTDSSGNVSGSLWFNDQITPSGTVYYATLFDASSNKVWGPEAWSLTGSSPLDVGTLIPTANTVSYSGAVLTTGDQTVAGIKTFTSPVVLSGGISRPSGAAVGIEYDDIKTENTQVIGLHIEQGLNPSGADADANFGQTTELFTVSSNNKNFSGSNAAVYGSLNHFGSGSLGSGHQAGGDFEAFNPGPSTVTLLSGVVGNVWNGGVAAGTPTQTPTNNGSVTNARAVEASVHNVSSGIISSGVGVYVNSAANTNGGSITNNYGIVVSDQTAGGTNYAILTGAGQVVHGDTVEITGHGTLPAATPSNLYIAGGFTSPVLGKIYVGDGSGWELDLAKRTGSADTTLFKFKDSGNATFSGIIDSYNGLATAGNGLSAISGATKQKSESAADTNVLTFTPPASAGQYRINFSMSVSASASGVLGWTATWKDSNGTAQAPTNLSLLKNGTAAPALTFTAVANDTYSGSVVLDVDNSATNIVVKMTLASGTVTAKASASIERIQ